MLAAGLPMGANADAGCKCRSGGQSYDLGAVVCIRGQLARCEMFLNNTSWVPTGVPCTMIDVAIPRVVVTMMGIDRPAERATATARKVLAKMTSD